ncbi:hypothetical protein [uncultured Tateyamaria sp.]|uniref:hypothetical protein n=1 Tax=uncultured Tateyamaria sp. TaxID=455651 RepID=UPI002639D3B8|nr:hypothetical protein [uncultured Tateyamaria sp.]
MAYLWEKESDINPAYYLLPYLLSGDSEHLVNLVPPQDQKHYRISVSDLRTAEGPTRTDFLAFENFLESFLSFTESDTGFFSSFGDDAELVLGPIMPKAVLADYLDLPDYEPVVQRFPQGTVAMAVIDTGVGFANQRFRMQQDSAHDTTRFEHIWLMDRQVRTEDGVAIGTKGWSRGTVISRRDINKLFGTHWDETAGELDEVAIYERLEPDPRLKSSVERNVFSLTYPHGSQVLDLMAGFQNTETDQGALRPLIAVDLPSRVVADTSGFMTASVIKDALNWILMVSRDMKDPDGVPVPLVITLPLAISSGPHSGEHPVEREFDHIVNSQLSSYGQKVELIMPVGNHRQDQLHAEVDLGPCSGPSEVCLDWHIPIGDKTASFGEIWLPPSAEEPVKPSVQIGLQPADTGNGPIYPSDEPKFGCIDTLKDNDGNVVATVYYRKPTNEMEQWRERIVVTIAATEPMTQGSDQSLGSPGTWILAIKNCTDDTLKVNARIQRDETLPGFIRRGAQSRLADPNYQKFDHEGTYPLEDPAPTAGSEPGLVTRRETISAVATGSNITRVTGTRPKKSPTVGTAAQEVVWYAGDPGDMHVESVQIQPSDFRRGYCATGLLSGSWTQLSGTSAASPLFARSRANQLA